VVVPHPPQLNPSEAQFQIAVKDFELAARAFQKRNYERAKAIFAKLAATAVMGVAERARVHLRLCEQKLRGPSPLPRSVEDLYAAGVGALNARRLDDAVSYLNKAGKAAPRLEHVQYALAAAHALRRESDAALHHLKLAILLRPGNRIQARYDEDFQSLAGDARFDALVGDSNSPHFPGFAKATQNPQPAP
jgi:tetratricopeptide (TPR) repeat protein